MRAVAMAQLDLVNPALQSAEGNQDSLQHDPAADLELQRWASANGIESRIAPADFDGGLRGAAATQDIAAGDCVVSVPASLLLSMEAAARSDFGAALASLPLDAQSRLLLWLMAERHDVDALHAPFWRALPQRFVSGLSFDEQALALLEGTPAHEQCAVAIQHIRAAYDALQPVIAALLQAYPQHLQECWFDWQAFLWATQFWYSYAMQVKLIDGDGQSVSREVVAPYACLLNHGAQPHVRQWQLRGERLELTAHRPAAAREQLLLSYGPHCNAHLLCFYGFVLLENPNDTITLSFKVMPDDRADSVRAVLLRLGVPMDHRIGVAGQLGPALTCLRVLHASRAQLRCIATEQDVPWDNDEAVWRRMRTALSALKGRLRMAQDRNSKSSAASSPQARLARQYICSQLVDVGVVLSALEQQQQH